ncbi:hypothetical protein [Halococcus thailandensis]|uniref:Uncharacterized protein n=1 Tax=Halococcus thailandensis JCM 13552 TaxID=1227457 RepID=M0NGP8_9EURY|nr:hypothetical protein [Halococcus thailandensis]EMA56738.1 hypothetical protein C451_00785 [Halococcus thailandensis JCM 13552]
MDDTTDSDSTETTTDNENEHGHEQEQEQDHDCQEHLEYVEYELVENGYDDIFVCRICEDEYRLVYARAFLLDGDDFSLVEEYTDSIEKELRQLRDTQDDDTDEDEESTEPVES